jgi:hypothetical protein
MKGGAFENLFDKVFKLYKQPSMAEVIDGIYELEYLDDMYNIYKDRRIDLYIDFITNASIIPHHLIILNQWIYELMNNLKTETIETFFQYQINLINILSKKIISKSMIQLWGISIFGICQKICSGFYAKNVDLIELMWISNNIFTEKKILDTSNEILNSFDNNIPLTPVMFFLNYWYLKSIYTSDKKEPNVKVLTTSVAVMLALMNSNTTYELKDVKIDDLAKYCVHKALTIEKYTNSANIHILTIGNSIDWEILDTCISDFHNKDLDGLNLYTNIKETLQYRTNI